VVTEGDEVRLLIQLIPDGQAVRVRVVRPLGRPRTKELPLPLPRRRYPRRWFAWTLLSIAEAKGAEPGDALAVTDPAFAKLVDEALRIRSFRREDRERLVEISGMLRQVAASSSLGFVTRAREVIA